MRAGRNLVYALAPDLADCADEREALVAVFRWAEERTQRTIDWYLWRKTSRARWSKVWRALSILLGVVGGLIPLAHAAHSGSLTPEWGFVFLAAAGACILADRLFGFSSSWMRFMSTQAELQGLMGRCQARYLAWSRDPSLDGKSSSLDSVELFSIVMDLISGTAEIVSGETAVWMEDLTVQMNQVNSRLMLGKTDGGHGKSSA